MQIVYILCDDNSGSYEIMTYISVCSLLRSNKQIKKKRVTIIAPESSREQLQKGMGHHFLSLGCSLEYVECTQHDPKTQSRILKTTLKKHIHGDFLFLDADTLIAQDLSNILNHHYDIAIANDLNCSKTQPGFPCEYNELYLNMKWNPTKNYYNSGVMAVKDNTKTHELFELWHHNWSQAHNRFGCIVDQPSLNYSIEQCNATVKILPQKYNAVVDAIPALSRNAAVLHFYTRDKKPRPDTIFAQLYDIYTKTGTLRWDLFELSYEQGHAWAQPCSFRNLIKSKAYLPAFLRAVDRAVYKISGKTISNYPN